MNFITHTIVNPVSNGPTFDEWLVTEISKVRTTTKTASEAKPECDDDPRGQCRGQVINNDNEDGAGYQKGESVSGKKEQGGNARQDTGGTTDSKDHKQKDKEASSKTNEKVAKCGKEMGESNDAGKVTEKHTEAAPGDDENKEPKILINNDPNYQKGESTGKGKKSDKSKEKTKKKASSIKFEKIASMGQKEKLSVFAMLTSDQKYPIAYAEAVTGIKFANLKEDEKKWLSEFWSILYPAEYVDEMIKDR